MEPGETPAPAFTDSLKELGDGVLHLVQSRVQLLVVELQEEKFRLVSLCMFVGGLLITGMLALTFVSLTLVYVFWETARLAVIGGLAAFYTASVIALVVMFRRHLARQPRPFAGTEWEIEEDRACIRKPS